MTKEEQNQTIKDAWVRNLQKEDNIPENVGEIYRNWVLGKIQQASSQLQQSAQPQQDEQAPAEGEQQTA